MFSQISLLQALEAQQSRTRILIQQLEASRARLPKGHLCCKGDGRYYRVIHCNGRRDYIALPQHMASSKTLASQLKKKRHIDKALPILKNSLRCFDTFLKSFHIYDGSVLSKELPSHYRDFDYSDLLFPGDVNPAVWGEQAYAHNTAHPEDLIYSSEGGLKTRSKAEADIATVLERRGFVFHYEPKLKLGKHIYYPDFLIVHPFHRRLIYWEHFGSMDNPPYAKATMEKLRVYAQNGYTLGDNLIMTWETLDSPLTFPHINDRIRTYFS
ncbi:hypothetical protein NE619_00225 [Anaerovorax odorimutans]|uniref:Uncharacterized protein n=1 Tax=Anaerovorax odorimutans TaxID=109327 RepID=A0ABT1RJ13_9FIRM|nr:hypothetical protein [Anaerovorax odorimutans]MCQ4635158.1 hypothetical protein [Anaerovorax odorimutans]